MTDKNKKQGLIRWNAIISFIIVSALFYLYFLIFFDSHVKSALEWAGYKALGSEVNISEFKTSFIQGKVHIAKVELTSGEQPEFNSLELGDIRFNLNWDALLRAKFVVEEIAIEGIQFMSKRAHPGKVAPPEPEKADEPSVTDQLKSKALGKLDKENQGNLLGDVAQFLKSGKFDDQIKNIESDLISKKLLQEMNTKWSVKQKEWDEKLKTLPSNEEVNALKERFNKVKLKDFANLQELDASVKEVDSIVKEFNTKSGNIQELKNQFETDLKSIDQDYKNVDQQVKKDIDNLKAHFKIPKIDAGNFAKAMFMGYLTPYTKKLDTYKNLAKKYLPPKYAKKLDGKEDEPKADDSIQPHPRTDGVSYEFPIKHGYPSFWIQKISISSKSNQSADYGDFSGLISNITSNQRQIGSPTTAKIKGAFNKLNIKGISLDAMLNNIPVESEIKFDFTIGSYPLKDIKLLDSKNGSILIPTTDANLSSAGLITGFKNFDLKLSNTFKNVNFQTSAEDKTVSDILKSTMSVISQFDLQASAKGELKNLNIDIRSSLAGDLEKSFQNLLQAKIKEANEQLQKAVNAEIGKLRSQVDGQIATLKAQADSEIKKIQSQIEEQKKQAETQVAKAKKDFEDQTKKKIQQEGQKQLDDLRKKIGL